MSILTLFLPLSFVSAGTITSPYKYAWSNNAGYINFENVVVDDGALSGYAWSANYGWIKFNPAQGGVLSDGAGNLSGSAWGEKLGWIDFNNVSINPSTGRFSGTATGTLIGTITFDCPNYCDVRTDWRQATTPAVVSSGGGGGGGGSGGTIIQTPTPIPTLPVEDLAMSAQAKLIDIQKDGVINILDFNSLMVNWGRAENLANVGSTFSVDVLNFNALMVYWGITYQI
ncbi:MAG: hypothetical protein A3D52_02555 [Candidatus Taylorbacteria bacterium RIFCSPHIGHO2_02_FULL_44_36]|uniref:Dockerin domain-containing protein n=1 Tax=Candidatus Taylorbacteria bacterium RIFCSPLOWO2_12_FULL_44_15c TaxID=1802333 RepID=A0A1G2P522_9BACT|nr:MAG: hypothetical protein A3D52_02555 [Candidatus Taylorbacteria bacterium RIFCSPHIGHO2_02_FULL_44_36]OHA38042.1 MAG: hypothetical protein A3I97_03040 [Candidatus Taylorbacteria bacterium RIFCSPLOWO2_02_FULL_44_35]OHA43426.1 MAG: hypothetical protein A3G03_01260 [Candidatus Taylorbacteria bacterium RIFCSPLOWO2_12_FULL_44_15c]